MICRLPFRSALVLFALAGCYDAHPDRQRCNANGKCGAGYECARNHRCYPIGKPPVPCTPTSCTAPTPWCDQTTGDCVACLIETDCPEGRICAGDPKQCVDGCSPTRPCLKGGICDVDAGSCGQCSKDSDCPIPPGDGGTIRMACCNHACVDLETADDHCGACGLDCGAGACCAGRCVDVNSNVDHCGGCDQVCSSTHVAPRTCLNGRCDGACESGFADCNQDKLADGCERPVAGDPLNCGGCDIQCSTAHVIAAACTSGQCTSACAGAFLDCNQDKLADGCEVDPTGDPRNCGGCGQACQLANATSACVQSACQVASCTGTFADCNGLAGDGCEIDDGSDVANCGGCGNACSSTNIASPVCQMGQCAGACNMGWADCDGNKLANGCEIQTATNLQNCGSCGNSCSTIHRAQCTSGSCGGCATGYTDCNGQAVDGCETNTAGDVMSCGACYQVCSTTNITRACQNGQCTGACNQGFADCDGNKQSNGCETNTATSLVNCGGCANSCAAIHRTQCASGVCTGCESGYTDCNGQANDGCETYTSSDVTNCGACGRACSTSNITRACQGGQCTGTCSAGFNDCNNDKQSDGCESNSSSDLANCGSCGNSCATIHRAQCSSGTCTGCENGYADCNGLLADGCEKNTASDADYCGSSCLSCSSNHVTSRTCTNGSCSGTCQNGWLDCDGNKQSNGCEAADPGTGICPPQVLASGLNAIAAIAVDGTGIYWTEFNATDNTGQVRKVGPNGGAITQLAGNQGWPQGIAVDDTYVFWVDYNGGGIRRASKADGSGQQWIASGITGPVDLARYGSSIYFSSYWTGTVQKVATAGGTVTLIGSGQNNVMGLAADASFVYWAISIGAGGGSVRKADVNGSAVVTTLLSGLTYPVAVAIDSAYVYFPEVVTLTSGAIKRAPLPAGGSPLQLASTAGPAMVTTDGTNVYWTDQRAGTVMRATIGGGSPVAIATGLSMPRAIALYGSYVYWSTGTGTSTSSLGYTWSAGNGSIRKVSK